MSRGTEGKRWEKNFKDSMGLECIRLYDPMSGFVGVYNPCDFIYYRYPYQFLFELKSVEAARLPIKLETTMRQIKSMVDLMKTGEGTLGGICVEFRSKKQAFFIPATVALDFLDVYGKASIKYDDCIEHHYIIEIPLTYKRTNCEVDKTAFNAALMDLMYIMRWGNRRIKRCDYH